MSGQNNCEYTEENQHHKFPSGLGYPKPEGKDEGESYTLFRTLLFFSPIVPFDPFPSSSCLNKERHATAL